MPFNKETKQDSILMQFSCCSWVEYFKMFWLLSILQKQKYLNSFNFNNVKKIFLSNTYNADTK